jgi:hypothetical protein
MRYRLGRLLQLVGMILLPIGISGEIAGKLTLKDELVLLLIGVAVFTAGWLVQQGARPP